MSRFAAPEKRFARRSEAQRLDEAFGVRTDIGKLPFIDYGFLDAVTHTGNGLASYKGLEAFLFAGKAIGDWTVETTWSFKEGGQRYGEFEVSTPTTAVGPLQLGGFVRTELPRGDFSAKPTAIGGVQVRY